MGWQFLFGLAPTSALHSSYLWRSPLSVFLRLMEVVCFDVWSRSAGHAARSSRRRRRSIRMPGTRQLFHTVKRTDPLCSNRTTFGRGDRHHTLPMSTVSTNPFLLCYSWLWMWMARVCGGGQGQLLGEESMRVCA